MIKKVVTAIVLILFIALSTTVIAAKSPTPAATPNYFDSLFERANEKYRKGKWDEAFELYSRISSRNSIKSPEVYFNMGQCCYQMGKKGKAMYYYLIANKLAPRDEEIKGTLSSLKEELTLSGAMINRPDLIPVVDTFTRNELVTVLFIVIAVLSIIAQINKKELHDLFWLYSTFWFVIFLLSSFITISFMKESYIYAIVAAPSAEIRIVKDLEEQPFYTLKEGSDLRVLKKEDGWVQVMLKQPINRESGWIPAKDLILYPNSRNR